MCLIILVPLRLTLVHIIVSGYMICTMPCVEHSLGAHNSKGTVVFGVHTISLAILNPLTFPHTTAKLQLIHFSRH